jgi:hypothetical protein
MRIALNTALGRFHKGGRLLRNISPPDRRYPFVATTIGRNELMALILFNNCVVLYYTINSIMAAAPAAFNAALIRIGFSQDAVK